MKSRLRIGILNIMHDKADTRKRYEQIFANLPIRTQLTFFYPRMHYLDRPVPAAVKAIAQPLALRQVSNFDGFIITGAPIEKYGFKDVTYIKEIDALLSQLNKYHIGQLYFCWGAMAAMNYYYGIEKRMLPHKIFGIYPHKIIHEEQLLHNLPQGFLAPHARYAEMNKKEIKENPHLQINAETNDGCLFMVTDPSKPERIFLFSHLEYDRQALAKEYQREITAYPDRHYRQPVNYSMTNPVFNWAHTQRQFFSNWLKQIQEKSVLVNC